MNNYDSICCFRGGDSSHNVRVCWEITMLCNLNCGFCHRTEEENSQFDFNRMGEAITLFKKLNARDIIITGGEPFLHPHLFEIIDTLHLNGFSVDICTNGTLISERNIIFFKQRLKEISISIDSYIPSIHDYARGQKGAWEKAIRAVELLVKHRLTVHVITLLRVETIKDIKPTISFLSESGISSISFIGYIPIGKNHNPLLTPNSQSMLREVFKDIRMKQRDISINTKQVFLDNMHKCQAGKSLWGVDPNLDIFPCLLQKQTAKEELSSKVHYGCCPGSNALVGRSRK